MVLTLSFLWGDPPDLIEQVLNEAKGRAGEDWELALNESLSIMAGTGRDRRKESEITQITPNLCWKLGPNSNHFPGTENLQGTFTSYSLVYCFWPGLGADVPNHRKISPSFGFFVIFDFFFFLKHQLPESWDNRRISAFIFKASTFLGLMAVENWEMWPECNLRAQRPECK